MLIAGILKSRVSRVALALAVMTPTAAFAQTPTEEDAQAEAPAEEAEPSAEEAAAADEAASAAEAAADDKDIVITGTSIRGVASVASQSVSLDRADMLKTGLSSSTDIVRTLPQVVNIGADESRRGGSQDAAANRTRTSGINLRGLSSEATLLLLNGRRLAPNGTIKALADPSMIPAIVVQRLEIVPDGASAIYGADAVAGVVNIITRRPFNGGELSLRYGIGDDIDQFQASALVSHKWATGGVLAGYEYNFRSNLAAADRDFLTADLRGIGGTDQRSTLAAPGNIVSGAGAAQVRYPLPNGNGRGLTPAQLAVGAPNRYDQGLVGDVLPEQERHAIFVSAFQDIGDRLTITYEGFYNHRTFEENVVPVSATLSVPRSNPFFVNPANPAAATVSVEYRFIDVNGDANWSGHDIGWQNALGIRYDVGGSWQLNAYAAISKNRGRARTEDLLNTVFSPLALADSSPLTAFNPFGNGDPANNNPETLRRLEGLRDSFTVNKGRDFVAKLDGPLFALPGGEIRLAVGAEYHENELHYTIFSSLKNVANNLILDRDRRKERNNHAFYAEAFIPIFGADNATTGFQSLAVQLAARYEEYSDFGDTFNPKVGVTWQPLEGLKLRGSWGTSFRAPSLIDSSDAIFNIFIQNLTDNGVVKRGIFMNGGRNDLTPETATTWSVGGDYRPTFLRGFHAGITYYNIKYKDVIDALGAATILSNNTLYGQYVVRNPTIAQVDALLNSPNLESVREPAANILLIVDGRRDNIGRLNQDGIDFQIDQQIETDSVGTFNLGLFVTRILNSKRSTAPGVPFVNALNIINFPLKTRVRGNLGWSLGGLSANLFWNHLGSYQNNLVTPVMQVDSYDTFDGSIGYSFDENSARFFRGMRFSINAQNIFDREPPAVINGTMGWDSQNASPIGRFVSFEFRKAW